MNPIRDERLDVFWPERAWMFLGYALATVAVIAAIVVPLAVGGLLIEWFL